MKIINGKVRDVYEISDEHLIIVTTDRISAFDKILSKPVKDKGKILTAISLFWFNHTKKIIPNHILSSRLQDMPEFFHKPQFDNRTVLVKKLKMLPFEFIVRGYMFGSMWRAYSENKEFCGEKITGNYKQGEKLAEPIFTPSTKAKNDEYITFEFFANTVGNGLAEKIKTVSIKLYNECYKYAYSKGLILADTKFEFGLDANNNLVLADEICTPDSSRYWSINNNQAYDKQFLRDWLLENEMQFENVPDEILLKTSELYHTCFEKITESETGEIK